MPTSVSSMPFLKMTPHEIVVLHRLREKRCHEAGIPDSFLAAYFSMVRVDVLIRHLYHYPLLNQQLRQAKHLAICERYLTQYAKRCGIKLEPQDGLHPLDLVQGHALYCGAMKQKRKSDLYFAYLEFAAQFHSYHAIYELNSHDLSQLKKVMLGKLEEEAVDPVAIFARAVTCATKHGTPGCWVAVETSYYLAQYYGDNDRSEALAKTSYEMVMYYCHLGVMLAEQGQVEISNAYNGKSYPENNILELPPRQAYHRFIDIALEAGVDEQHYYVQAKKAAKQQQNQTSATPMRESTLKIGSHRESVPIRN